MWSGDLASQAYGQVSMRYRGVVFARDGSVTAVHRNWQYCTISCSIKVHLAIWCLIIGYMLIQHLYSKWLMWWHPEVCTRYVEYSVFLLCVFNCVWVWIAKEMMLGLKVGHMWDKMKLGCHGSWGYPIWIAMVMIDLVRECLLFALWTEVA